MAIVVGNLDLSGQQLQNACQHTYSALPTFATADYGRVIYVSSGADVGYWLGGADGTAFWGKLHTGTTISEYDAVGMSIADGVSYSTTLSAAGTAAIKGFIAKVELTTVLVSGRVIVQLFNDVAMADRFYHMVFDLSGTTTDTIPAFFEVDNAVGNIYITITNNTGSLSLFDISIKTCGVLVVEPPPPPGTGSGISSGVAGDGLSYNPTRSELEVTLGVNPGLALTGVAGDRTLGVKPSAGGGLTTTVNGVECDTTVVRTTGNQSVAGKKIFTDSTFGAAPAATPGPPIAGAWSTGAFYLDSNQDMWFCSAAGSPGTWIFWGWKISHPAVAYTGAIVAGTSADVAIASTGRRGIIRKLNAWVTQSAYTAADYDVPFRIACYPDENYYGRDQIWSVVGSGRVTYATAIAAGGTATIEVNTVNVAEPDDLIRLYEVAGPTQEFGRITVRNTTPPVSFTLDENLVNAVAINDLMMAVTEFVELPWWNVSAVPANYQKIYLRFSNDHPTASILVGYDIYIESIGGGATL